MTSGVPSGSTKMAGETLRSGTSKAKVRLAELTERLNVAPLAENGTWIWEAYSEASSTGTKVLYVVEAF